MAGKPWIDLHAESRGLRQFKTEKCSKVFKFGPSLTQEAKEKVVIPVKIGSKTRILEVYVIKSTLPLLLSSSELIKWGAVQDYASSTLTVDNEVIKLNKMDSGHYGIDLGRTEEVMNCYTVDEVFNQDKNYQRKEIKKIHKIMGHPSADKLIEVYRNRGTLNKKLTEIIRQCYDNCKICKKHSKNQPRPKVGLPKASEANEVISLDLKNVSSLIKKPEDKRYILYFTDEF